MHAKAPPTLFCTPLSASPACAQKRGAPAADAAQTPAPQQAAAPTPTPSATRRLLSSAAGIREAQALRPGRARKSESASGGCAKS